MQYVHREIYSLEEALEENYIEKEEIRSCERQEIRTLEKKYRTTKRNRS